MTNEKPVESRFQEYLAFTKKHKLATALIVIWLVAPTINPLAGNPTIVIDISGEAVIELTGNH